MFVLGGMYVRLFTKCLQSEGKSYERILDVKITYPYFRNL